MDTNVYNQYTLLYDFGCMTKVLALCICIILIVNYHAKFWNQWNFLLLLFFFINFFQQGQK